MTARDDCIARTNLSLIRTFACALIHLFIQQARSECRPYAKRYNRVWGNAVIEGWRGGENCSPPALRVLPEPEWGLLKLQEFVFVSLESTFSPRPWGR